MNDKQNNEKKLSNLLKSSLPLEQLVSEKLEQLGLRIAGVYPYIRHEGGINKEVSIDLYADDYSKPFLNDDERSDHLNLLIECKYNHPNVDWVFTSQTSKSPSLYTLDWSPYNERVSCYYHGLNTFLPVCTRGIGLSYDKGDPDGIFHGLNQLRYGMPNLILQEASEMISSHAEIRLNKSYIGLVLVTNAKLYVLKSDQNLETYSSASSLEDVAEQVDALLVEQERGPHFYQYCSSLLQPLDTISIISLDDIYRGIEDRSFLDSIIPNCIQIIVVHLDAMVNLIKTIKLVQKSK